ncbi:zinc finger MYM-type protein 1-like [Platichthys flesus]|uniref:zinc finger MYM-type protein 1-like n=1 Tax=Platichthys flesus TaxID=8260 RepID=UPI002DBCB56A|nr:zinc finger MYM-type protein 1-like [Platichthys flesus]
MATGTRPKTAALLPHSIQSLLLDPFERRPLDEQLQIKESGPDRPELTVCPPAGERAGKMNSRGFSRKWYSRKSWLAGCSNSNAFFCFPCLLLKTAGADTAWTVTGIQDMHHISEKIRKHECSRAHLVNTMELATLGTGSVAEQLDENNRGRVRRHNEEVLKNRHILSKLVDCVLCGAFELDSRLHGDTADTTGRGLDGCVASLDSVLEEHLKKATVFRGSSKTVHQELLDSMLSVLKECILDEVQGAEYLAIQVDETTGVSTHSQLVLVLRYIDRRNNVQERFFDFIPLQDANADSIVASLLERLSTLLPEGRESRLIAQAYDGAAVMRGAKGGVHGRVLEVYGNAHYVHCYAHHLDVIMEQATSHIPPIRAFFSDLGGFSEFFSRSFKRTKVLEEVVARRLPGTSTTKWNLHTRALKPVYEHQDDLLLCFQTIRDSSHFDPQTVREAGGFVRMLQDEDFCFFLALFHKIMPNVDTLSKELQKKNIITNYSTIISGIIQSFTDNMQKIRDSFPSLHGQTSGSVQEQPRKKKRTLGQGEHQQLATEVCETILSDAKDRLSFTKHLISATLLRGDLFPEHDRRFPDSALDTTVEAYPMLSKAKLKTELSLIYKNNEFRTCSSALTLFLFFMENNLQDTFTETVSLLRILITTPMTSAESGRCFSTLKRIKTFLRNTKTQGHLNALAMLSMEKKLVRNIPDFNNRVIERFANQKERRAKFLYK